MAGAGPPRTVLYVHSSAGRYGADRQLALVVSHLETLDRQQTRVLCSLIDKHGQACGPRLVGTMVPGAARDPSHAQPLIDRFGARITIPPLRERPEDIISLVATMTSGATASCPGC